MRISSSSLPQPTAHFSDGTRFALCSGPPPEPRGAVCALLKTCNHLTGCACTADCPPPRGHSKAPHRVHRLRRSLKTLQAPTPERRHPCVPAPFFPPASTQFCIVAKGTNTR